MVKHTYPYYRVSARLKKFSGRIICSLFGLWQGQPGTVYSDKMFVKMQDFVFP